MESQKTLQAIEDQKELNVLSNQIVWLKSQLLLQQEEAVKIASTQDELLEKEREKLDDFEKHEKQKLERKIRLEQMARERRLIQVEETEKSSKATMEKAQELRELQLRRLDKEAAIRKRKEDWEAKTAKEEAALNGLEMRAAHQTTQMHQRMADDESARLVRAQLIARQREEELLREMDRQDREHA